MSVEDLLSALSDAARQKFGPEEWSYVEHTADGKVVIEREGSHRRYSWSISDGVVSIEGDGEEVRKVVHYETVAASAITLTGTIRGAKGGCQFVPMKAGRGMNFERGHQWNVPNSNEGLRSVLQLVPGMPVHWHETIHGSFDHDPDSRPFWIRNQVAGHLKAGRVVGDEVVADFEPHPGLPERIARLIDKGGIGLSIEAACERRFYTTPGGERLVDLVNFTHGAQAPASVAIVSNPALSGEIRRIAASVKKESAVSDTATENPATTSAVATVTDAEKRAEAILASAAKKAKEAEEAAERIAAIEASLKVKRIEASTREKIAAYKLPDEHASIAYDIHASEVARGDTPSDDAIKTTCERIAKVLASSDAKVTGLGSKTEVGPGAEEKLEVGLEWLISRNMPARIKEVYASQNGGSIEERLGKAGIGHRDRPYSLNRFMRETIGTNLADLHASRYGNRGRAREIMASITTSTFGDAFENVLNKRMIAYSEDPNFSDWRRVVTTRPLNDIRKQERIAKGGYANLSSVAEGQDYQALTTPGDYGHGYTPVKYGGTEDWTEESQINDDVGVLSDITAAMGLAAARTLYEDVFDMLTIAGQPTMDYDAVALFNSTSHGNKGTTALNTTSLAARELNFRKRADFSNSKRLGLTPHFLIVPVDLRQTAFNLLKPLATYHGGDTGDREFLRQFNLEIIVVRHWTNTADWFLMADPSGGGVFEWGFLNGMEDPILYMQDLPNVGSRFDADKITLKIKRPHNNGSPLRHEYFDGNDV